jgi:hypothetical protein
MRERLLKKAKTELAADERRLKTQGIADQNRRSSGFIGG